MALYIGVSTSLNKIPKVPNGKQILDDNRTIWVVNGRKHRGGDLPAETHKKDGYKAWFKNGVLHRDGGKPAVMDNSGLEEYWINGKKVKGPKNGRQ